MSNERLHRIYPPILERARELRQPQTASEQKLWSALRNRQLGGFKFRRQHPIDRFIVDFYCHECALVVEVDGDSHVSKVEYYHVVRFTNQEVTRQLPVVLEAIWQECVKHAESEDSPSP